MINTQNNRSGAGGAAPQRQKLTLRTNVPAIVRLEFDPPKQARDGRFGDQFMYWLTDETDGAALTLWADPPLHEQIVATGARAGQVIVLAKNERRDGSRKWIEYEANLYREDLRPSAIDVKQIAPHAPAIAQPAAARIAPTSAAPSQASNPMATALTQAIEACRLAGYEARTEDVRALAITIYIQAFEGKK